MIDKTKKEMDFRDLCESTQVAVSAALVNKALEVSRATEYDVEAVVYDARKDISRILMEQAIAMMPPEERGTLVAVIFRDDEVEGRGAQVIGETNSIEVRH